MFQPALQEILSEISGATPTPGGGSVAAMGGANGAALLAMVCRLTIGKKKYENVSAEMEKALVQASVIQERLAALVIEDSHAYDQVMAALKLPKETAEQNAERQEAIQEATRQAIAVPLETMRVCLRGLELAELVVEKGNSNALSDGAVAALMLEAGVQGANLNVAINLNGLKDAEFAAECRNEIKTLLEKASQIKLRILEEVRQRLG